MGKRSADVAISEQASSWFYSTLQRNVVSAVTQPTIPHVLLANHFNFLSACLLKGTH